MHCLDYVNPNAGEQPFTLLGRVMKAHARVIWACSWAPNDRSFATGARDSLVKVWTLGSGPEGVSMCQGPGMTRVTIFLLSQTWSGWFVELCVACLCTIVMDLAQHRAFADFPAVSIQSSALGKAC